MICDFMPVKEMIPYHDWLKMRREERHARKSSISRVHYGFSKWKWKDQLELVNNRHDKIAKTSKTRYLLGFYRYAEVHHVSGPYTHYFINVNKGPSFDPEYGTPNEARNWHAKLKKKYGMKNGKKYVEPCTVCNEG